MSLTYKNYILLFILLAISGLALAQLSPGDLSNAHSHLEGLTNCTKCHTLGEKETSSKCLECHKEIKNLIGQNKGFHATTAGEGKECHDCHGEHFGREFQIVRFEKDTFNHSLTAYELEGKHAEIECAGCHKPELIQINVSQKKGFTWLGLGTRCLDCHTDFHQNTLSDNCLSCHNQTAFRPAPGFNHAKTDFPLIGKHLFADCEKCHVTKQQNGQEFQQFAGIEFSKCTDCHEDVHQNKFGKDCRKCHNEFSFNEVIQLSSFNHEQTDFPLRGKHVVVDCKKCHASGGYTKSLNHQHCSDCHYDYHEGQFNRRDVPQDCKECHSVNGFAPSSYGIAQHDQTGFKLEGAHLATPCFACHKKTDEWRFSGIGSRCIDCHDNIHKGYFDEKFLNGGDCNNCHSVMVWNKVTFDHDETGFKLQGKHAQTTCRQCHFAESEMEMKQQFTWDNETCTNCHEDSHFGQFIKNGESNCERCHTFTDWSPAKFDHGNARFKLDGKHAGLACISCHKPNVEEIEGYIVYKFEDISCESCH
jgi:nitrate/TMAO reductase-like tetraheme cytochrome c subunit